MKEWVEKLTAKFKSFGRMLQAGKKAEKADENNESRKAKMTTGQLVATIIGAVLCVILVPILIFNLTLIVKGWANDEKVPTIFGIAPMIVLSGSMEPEIYTGDLIFIKEVDADTLEVGDVIAFMTGSGTEVVTHRINEIQEVNGVECFQTLGDNNLGSVDKKLVAKEDVVGLYSKKDGKGVRIKGLGDFAMFLQKPYGMIVFIGIPIIGFVLYDVIKRQIEIKKQREEDGVTEGAIPSAVGEVNTLVNADAEIADKEAELQALRAKLAALEAENKENKE